MSEIVGIWRSSVDDVITLVEPLDEVDWARATPCPGWTVADIVAHIIDLDSFFLGDPRIDHTPDWDSLPHVTRDGQRITEIGVDARRGRSREELLAELRDVVDRRHAQLRDADMQATVQWFLGEIPVEQLMQMRTFDIWVHEQDIRDAVGRPGGMDSAGAQVAWARVRDTMPFIWGKKIGAQGSLELLVTGPGPSGRYVIAVDGGRARYVDDAHADVRIEITWADLIARAGGRKSVDEIDTTISGDADTGRRFLEALTFTP
jgi:uncharacterized protein (TIGR03083 family)